MITVANPIYDAVYVEEEYFQAIENRDTAIMMCDEKIREQDNQIAEQNNRIAEQETPF